MSDDYPRQLPTSETVQRLFDEDYARARQVIGRFFPLDYLVRHYGRDEAERKGLTPGYYVLGYQGGEYDPRVEIFVSYAYSPDFDDTRGEMASRIAWLLNENP